jgi:hypothetical protein
MAPKATVTAVASKTTSTASTGLQLSAAQWKAYSAAYSATQRQAALNAATQTLRTSRLSAAYSIAKKTAAAHSAARTAAIAAFAAKTSFRQSQLAHQNAALMARVYADYERHVQVAARLQYTYKGEAVYRHTAVMNTLTTAQAYKITNARFAAAAKAAKTATTAIATNTKISTTQAAVNAQANTAGLKAAKATPAGATAPRPVHLTPPEAEEAVCFGDPAGHDCVAAAIANHLLWSTGHRLSPERYTYLAAFLGNAPEVFDALNDLSQDVPWEPSGPYLDDFFPVTKPTARPQVIKIPAVWGEHAACLTAEGVASWGELLTLEEVAAPGAEVEQAWDLVWRLPR